MTGAPDQLECAPACREKEWKQGVDVGEPAWNSIKESCSSLLEDDRELHKASSRWPNYADVKAKKEKGEAAKDNTKLQSPGQAAPSNPGAPAKLSGRHVHANDHCEARARRVLLAPLPRHAVSGADSL